MKRGDYARYMHEDPNWPRFEWQHEALATLLASVRHRQGRLIGHMEAVGLPLRSEAVLQTLTQGVVQSSAIEGEQLNVDQVRLSVARRLGLDIAGLPAADRYVDGVVEMIMDATTHFAAPLDEERLYAWHSALFPIGRSGLHRIIVGAWRDERSGPMQVVSGPLGRERVHFQAPDAKRLPLEMNRFLECLGRAIDAAETTLTAIIRKARFWESLSAVSINPRQRAILNRLLDGFEGKLTSSKWAKITQCSPDTALRDITDLITRGILTRDAASCRSTSYSLRLNAAS